MFNFKLPLQQNKEISSHYRLFSFSAPQMAKVARPGQFLMLRISDSFDPFLSRPMSVHQINRDKKGEPEGFTVLFKIVGKGTKLLAQKKVGEQLQVIGPLGNGFTFNNDTSEALVVAGGIGVAPLLFLAKEVASTNAHTKTFIGGATSQDLLMLDEFKEYSHDLFITTEDGSTGKQGLITQSLEEYLSQGKHSGNAMIYACGPCEMLKKIAQVSEKYSLPCQLSLEERMACGVGACLGCSVKIKAKGDDYQYKRVCVEGPVFNAHEVIW